MTEKSTRGTQAPAHCYNCQKSENRYRNMLVIPVTTQLFHRGVIELLLLAKTENYTYSEEGIMNLQPCYFNIHYHNEVLIKNLKLLFVFVMGLWILRNRLSLQLYAVNSRSQLIHVISKIAHEIKLKITSLSLKIMKKLRKLSFLDLTVLTNIE